MDLHKILNADLLENEPIDFVAWSADYTEANVRAKATEVIELVGNGLLAVLVDPEGAVSFVVMRWSCGGGTHDEGRNEYSHVFRGCGYCYDERMLRHTWWGDACEGSDGYMHLPHGPLIADAFEKLKRWFDFDGAEPAIASDVEAFDNSIRGTEARAVVRYLEDKARSAPLRVGDALHRAAQDIRDGVHRKQK
jgi:hypothetical protein